MSYKARVLEHLGTVLEKDRADRVRNKVASRKPKEELLVMGDKDKGDLEAAGNDAFIKARHDVAPMKMDEPKEEALVELTDDDKDNLSNSIQDIVNKGLADEDGDEEAEKPKKSSSILRNFL